MLDNAAKYIADNLSVFTVPELTVVVLAYAKAGYRAPALFDAIAAAILELKEDMTVSAAREQGRRCRIGPCCTAFH